MHYCDRLARLESSISGKCGTDYEKKETNASRERKIGSRGLLGVGWQPEASAIAYTMVEMAKAHNLNIYQYLSYVLEQRPNENWSDEQLAELAPWSEKLQTLKMWEWICSKKLQLEIGWGKFIGTAGLFGAYGLTELFRSL